MKQTNNRSGNSEDRKIMNEYKLKKKLIYSKTKNFCYKKLEKSAGANNNCFLKFQRKLKVKIPESRLEHYKRMWTILLKFFLTVGKNWLAR